jgi:thioredoxin/glutathione reductase (selenoprotein)
MTSRIIYIKSKSHLEELLQSEKLVIDYYAIWCDDCDYCEETFIKMSQKYSDITFAKLSVDIQELKDFYTENSVVEIPTFHFFEKGTKKHVLRGSELDQLVGSCEALHGGSEYPPNKLATARLGNTVICSSNDFRIVNDVVYFPISSLVLDYFIRNETDFDIKVGELVVKGGCKIIFPSNELYYLKDHVSFMKEVTVTTIGKPTEFVTHYGHFPEYDYDLIVIGGGSGGFQCAKKAAKSGAKVAVFNFVESTPHGTHWGLGGTCVNAGCIPKKLFHQAGIHQTNLQDASDFGWKLNPKDLKHDWNKLQESVTSYVSKLNWKHEGGLRNARVKYHHAWATFIDDKTISAKFSNGEVKKFTAKYFVIAAGSRPKKMGIPGEDLCITSDDVFRLKKSPGKTLIIGGSYIALETAGFLSSLGYDVSSSVRDKVLRNFDTECAEKIQANLEKNGVKFLRPSEVTNVKKSENQLVVQFKESADLFDTVLIAIGRTPSTHKLGLEHIKAKMDTDGRILVNDLSVNGSVFAIGDVIHNKFQLTPVAIHEGKHVALKLFANSKKKMNYELIPTTVFTPEEYGSCGLTESQAVTKFGIEDVEIYKKSVNVLEYQMGFQFSKHDQAFFKLVCIKSLNERVVGFHYIGPNAGEITVGISMAMRFNITKDDLDDCVGIHPTLAEAVTQLEKGVVRDTGC